VAASRLAARTPTLRQRLRPGPMVTATADKSDEEMFDRDKAWWMQPSMAEA
jgi:hypothetical protein